MAEVVINVDNIEQAISLFGNYDENINILQKQYNVAILNRGNDIRISGGDEEVNKAKTAVNTLKEQPGFYDQEVVDALDKIV